MFFGGRGGLKSWGCAQALELKGHIDPLRVLCTRELQTSIKESVHKLLSDTVERIGMGYFYEVLNTSITGNNGTSFLFEGLKNNTSKVRSLEGIDICWCEEAEAITEDSWDILEPTIRKPGSEIWVTFNPDDEMGATYQKFVTPYLDAINEHGFYEDDDIYVRKIGWEDADAYGWFPDELRKQKDKLYRERPKQAAHVWGGEPNTDYTDSVIQPEWVDAAIDAHIKLGFEPRGVKSLGFDPADEGNDAKAFARAHGCYVEDVQQWTDGDVGDATQRIWDECYEQRITDLVYDNIGIGAAVKTKLKTLTGNESLNIRGFSSSGEVDYAEQKYLDDRRNADVFRNIRAQYWWYLRDRFEDTYNAVERGIYSDPEKLISLNGKMPLLKQLKAELTRVQRNRSRQTSGLIQIESKQDMKARALKSPNLADALVYTFAYKPVAPTKGLPLDYSARDGKRKVTTLRTGYKR